MNIEIFEKALLKNGKFTAVPNGNDSEAALIYIFKCLYDNKKADKIDFSRFTMADIQAAIDEVHTYISFNEGSDDGTYTVDCPHYVKAIRLSEKEAAIMSNFLNDKYPRKMRKVTFL